MPLTPRRLLPAIARRRRMLANRGDEVECPVCEHSFARFPRRLEPAERALLAMRVARAPSRALAISDAAARIPGRGQLATALRA